MPRIFRADGKIVGIRFPKPTRNEDKIIIENGRIPYYCYDYDSDEQQVIQWIAQQEIAKSELQKRESGGYDLTITFVKEEEARKFANDFLKKYF